MSDATQFILNLLIERDLQAPFLQSFRETVTIDSSDHQDLNANFASGVAARVLLDASSHPRTDAVAQAGVRMVLDVFGKGEALRGPHSELKPLLATGPGEVDQLAQRDATLVQYVLNPELAAFIAHHLLRPIVSQEL